MCWWLAARLGSPDLLKVKISDLSHTTCMEYLGGRRTRNVSFWKHQNSTPPDPPLSPVVIRKQREDPGDGRCIKESMGHEWGEGWAQLMWELLWE